MKPGARAAGVAESYDGEHSTLAAAVVRADRVVDGFAFGECAVGGTDATDRVGDLLDALDREDLHAVLLAGIAPAWYNLLDLAGLHDRTGLPVVSVSFEASDGLEPALRDAFDGDALAERLAVYRRQPERERVAVNDEQVWVRTVGVDPGRARELVRAFTPEGGRPEPLRVARLAARAADRFRPD
ncbi:MAG: DUF99 family protein [Halobacteriales archaeon]